MLTCRGGAPLGGRGERPYSGAGASRRRAKRRPPERHGIPHMRGSRGGSPPHGSPRNGGLSKPPSLLPGTTSAHSRMREAHADNAFSKSGGAGGKAPACGGFQGGRAGA